MSKEQKGLNSKEISVLMIITILMSDRYCGSEKDTLNQRLERFSLEDEDINSDEFLKCMETLSQKGLIHIEKNKEYYGTVDYEIEPYMIDIPGDIEYELTDRGNLAIKLLTPHIDKEDIKVEKIANGAITVYKCTVSITKKLWYVLEKIGIYEIIKEFILKNIFS